MSLVSGGFAHAQSFADVIRIDQIAQSDQYVAGRIVRVSAPIQGDLIVAGQRLVVNGDIQGDLTAAGESVDIRAPVVDDVRAAGRTINVNNSVGGHMVSAGDTVLLSTNSSVREWAWLAGRSIDVQGSVGGDLRAAGKSILISGDIAGDAIVTAENIQVKSDAVIHGDLIVQSSYQPTIDAGATVKGEIIHERLGRKGLLVPFMKIGTALLFMTSIIIAVLTIFLLFPQVSGTAVEEVRNSLLGIFGLGISFAFVSPIVIAILFMTGIGLIIGLLLLGGYLLALLLGLLIGIVVLSQYALDKFYKQKEMGVSAKVLIVTLTTVVFLILSQLPVLGFILLSIVWITGLGVTSRGLWRFSRESAGPVRA